MNGLLFFFVFLTTVFTVVQPLEFRTDQELEAEANIIREHSGCECKDHCSESSGVYNVTCEFSNVVYFGCKQSSCKVEFCPTDQIFNKWFQMCEFCPTGLKPRSDSTHVYCACPLGTKKFDGHQCLPCEPYDCDCHGLVYDVGTRQCRKCPNNTINVSFYCQCTDPRMFWNNAAFACKECPGNLVKNGIRGYGLEGDYRCDCPPEMILNYVSFTCVACPPDSSLVLDDGGYPTCRCLDSSKHFAQLTNSCVGRVGYDDD